MGRMNISKTIVLLGSGFSIPAGMPSTEEITKEILFGKERYLSSVETFVVGQYPQKNLGLLDHASFRAKELIKFVAGSIDSFYSSSNLNSTNYEEIMYVISQIHDHIYGEYINPALEPYTQQLLESLRPSFEKRPGEMIIEGPCSFEDYVNWSHRFVTDVVTHELTKSSPDVEKVNFLVELITDLRSSNLDIFTLNHDTVLEQLFLTHGVAFEDGFDDPEGELRIWHPDRFENKDRLRLFKLHGSVDWFDMTSDGSLPHRSFVAKKHNTTEREAIGPDRRMYREREYRPLILIGTHNKILDYQRGVFWRQHLELLRSLTVTTSMIVCGYSFGDKAINTRLIEWMDENSERKIVIVDPAANQNDWIQSPAISRNLVRWLEESRAFCIPKGAEQVTWSEINSFFST